MNNRHPSILDLCPSSTDVLAATEVSVIAQKQVEAAVELPDQKQLAPHVESVVLVQYESGAGRRAEASVRKIADAIAADDVSTKRPGLELSNPDDDTSVQEELEDLSRHPNVEMTGACHVVGVGPVAAWPGAVPPCG